MKTINKKDAAYKTIGEVAKALGLVNKETGHLQTHTIRYWETQFKQIRPNIRAGKRRYYSVKDLKIISFIKFLLKEKKSAVIPSSEVTALNRHVYSYVLLSPITPTVFIGNRAA